MCTSFLEVKGRRSQTYLSLVNMRNLRRILGVFAVNYFRNLEKKHFREAWKGGNLILFFGEKKPYFVAEINTLKPYHKSQKMDLYVVRANQQTPACRWLSG